jgi:hypothetical protein
MLCNTVSYENVKGGTEAGVSERGMSGLKMKVEGASH